MRDLADIKDLFEHDELVHDFEFAKRLYDTEIVAYEKYADDDDLIWGDLVS